MVNQSFHVIMKSTLRKAVYAVEVKNWEPGVLGCSSVGTLHEVLGLTPVQHKPGLVMPTYKSCAWQVKVRSQKFRVILS